MSCITELLKLKGDKEFLPVHEEIVIEVGDSLICVKCRFDDIGKDALKEPLYWDL